MRRRWILALTIAPMLLPPLAYLAAAALLSRWTVPGEPPAARGVEVGVCDNGVHTDLLLPVAAAGADWRVRLDFADFPGAPPDADRILVGWGDRDFYLETRAWSDLRPGLAWRALFGGGPSVLHVHLLRGAPISGCRFLVLGADAYRRLDGFVDAALLRDAAGAPRPLRGYGRSDMFYAAAGSYSPIHTCNQWTTRALRAAGVETGVWTPFAGDVMRRLPAVRSADADPFGRGF
ncbi:conserved exported hypothetical protein [uncultured Alphaproteobacteria bacterium]|uniref:DUF2459 domain-containing protein n=1 Tax=uncultured Alphaproteobacteria bacterium TaxID=91750 RepID=A0A212JW21_9PROT|nr:conserved exported hypothetical protein [uncultured Alphaproteobacteria bacterium]